MATILLVEDDAIIQENLAAILVDEGYAVVCASDGAQALQLLASGPGPDVLLLDLMMPVMDGWQMRKVMLDDLRWRNIPCIIVSGVYDLRTHVKALAAQGFITKPIDLFKLLNAIESCVTKQAQTNPPV